MIKLYGIKNCSTCVKAIKWAEAQGLEFEFIDYRANPIASNLLNDWATQLGGWPKLVNRASMTWRKLDDAAKNPETDEEWLSLIAENPTLVRRPVTQKEDGSVMVGFNEAKLGDFLA
ncbi:Spx/MgsR family RNA polymerase-binding regulatory protein [Paenalcaligenes niemegkensis]|uniref:Spx/MgsR family RNA polymerase-binding regulatory protein n=1 Tax=Paenalcaligenes niemegkensis TaxID=2895469 RepID=UPI001EE9047C|nr:Spx/MgsR family RNA polymerase-binding regulatory protein [Paenalcaligenes niemegkensis]MCQ9615622.1 Spx/MgsR family RNA polymerase-binding regulatory protein [Paenalcaligenes niemegkensis]